MQEHPDDVDELTAYWPELLKQVQSAAQQGDAWARELDRLATQADQAIQGENRPRILERFRRFSSREQQFFFELDQKLKSQISELPTIAKDLDRLLGAIE